jgi:hypothetical protein
VSRKRVAYFDGTDPWLLTALICDGYDTIPVSNDYDNHGRHIRLVTHEDKYDLVLGHVHKIFAPQGSQTTYQDIFHICRVRRMPLVLEVPTELHDEVGQLLADPPEVVRFVAPEDMLETAREILKG